MTPTVTKISSSRCSNDAPCRAPRAARARRRARSRRASRSSRRRAARASRRRCRRCRSGGHARAPSSGGTACHASRTPMTTRLTTATSSEQRAGVAGRAHAVEDALELQAEQHEQRRVEAEHEHLPERERAEARVGVEHLVRVPAEPDAGGHGRQHAGRVQPRDAESWRGRRAPRRRCTRRRRTGPRGRSPAGRRRACAARARRASRRRGRPRRPPPTETANSATRRRRARTCRRPPRVTATRVGDERRARR